MFFSLSGKISRIIKIKLLFAIILATSAQQCLSKEHVIKAVGMKWKPELLVINPGDSVKFVDMMGHDTQSMGTLTPLDYGGWKSTMGEENFTIEFDEKGIYFHKCNPHVNAGMFGAILVSTEISESEFNRLSVNAKELGIGGPAVRKIFKRVSKKINNKVVAKAF